MVDEDFFSADRKQDLKKLEAVCTKILFHKEETIRQKSWVVWIKVGDGNTNYFHNFANRRRLTNALWEAFDEDESQVYDERSIKMEARK